MYSFDLFSETTETYWTSGSDLAKECHFAWMTNGRPFEFTDWGNGEPNKYPHPGGEKENCVQFLYNEDSQEYKWNDSICNYEYFFICQKNIEIEAIDIDIRIKPESVDAINLANNNSST